MQRWRNEEQQRENAEALKISEIEAKTAPQRQMALELLQERMNIESDSYGKSGSASDKLFYALSWLWKWNEAIKIVGSKPKVKGSYSNPTYVEVVSEGYVNASPQSLLSAAELTENLSLANMAKFEIVSNQAPKLLFPVEYPRKAKEFKATVEPAIRDRVREFTELQFKR